MDEYDDLFAATNVTRPGAMAGALRGQPPQPQPQRKRSSSVTNSVSAHPPQTTTEKRDDWRERNRTLQEEVTKQLEALNAEPDLSGLQQEAGRRREGATSQLMLALGAQYAGKDFEPVQAHFLKQSAAMRSPMKFTGGQISETGEFVRDPMYMQEKKRETLEKQRAMLMQQELAGLTAEQTGAYQQAMARAAQTRADRPVGEGGGHNMIQIEGPDGKMYWADPRSGNIIKPVTIPGMPGAPGQPPAPGVHVTKPSTGDEKTSAGFLHRMQLAEQTLDTLNKASPGTSAPGYIESGVEMLPGAVGRVAGRVTRAADVGRNQVRQAQEDWVRAKLRKESGAAIPPEEMDREIDMYFPTAFDSEDDKAQKRASRKAAEEQMRITSGRAYTPSPTGQTGGASGGWSPPNPAQQRKDSYYGK